MQQNPGFLKAFGIGVLDAVIITAIMLPLVLSGILGIEQPFAVSFVRAIFGDGAPLPLGLAFHLVYVIFWSTIFVLYLTRRPWHNAFALAGVLWLVQAVIFYPVVGWGFLGLSVPVSTALIPLIPHILLAIILGVTGTIINKRSRV